MAGVERHTKPEVRHKSPIADQSWHALTADETLAAQRSALEGLAESAVGTRLERFGPNHLPSPKRRGPVLRFCAQFNDVLIYVLLAAALVTGLIGHWIDAQIILAVVLVNAVIGFLQEGKAEKALLSIRALLAPTASVIRNGRRVSVAGSDVVPGDIVVLEAGGRVPADVRLIEAKSLKVQEAILTGESVPVEKSTSPVDAKAALGDQTSMAFSGTHITFGQAKGVVVATGPQTAIGQISNLISEVTTLQTPLTQQMSVFAKWLTGSILAVAGLVFAFGLFVHDLSIDELFMAVVGLTVAAIPEGLPAILTITLAIGVQGMAQRNAIVRRLPAIETLGSVSVICTDKTGTLTRNEMTVVSMATAQHLYTVTGIGYDPVGDILLDGHRVEPDIEPALLEMARAALLCNEANLREADDQWLIDGDPMEAALISAAFKSGLDQKSEDSNYPRIDSIPFDSEHQFMATLHHEAGRPGAIFVKGAPERILDMCALQSAPNEDIKIDSGYWRQQVDRLATDGQRVLAVARKATDSSHKDLTFNDVEDGLTLLGLFGLLDPPRENAVSAVAESQRAGIHVKMITGDHAGTAKAIARDLGLENPDAVVIGQELDQLDESGFRQCVKDTTVFARTSPEHKLRLVMALQAEGAVVAMTGDGVNDAPALKRADIGIAMGQKGSEAAKEAAEMVLADDNFATIVAAIRAGRTVYDNLKKAILFILPTSFAEALVLVSAILLGFTLPITAAQILWINMVTTVTLALALGFEPAEPNVMLRPPRRPNENILSGFLIWRIVFVSVLFLGVLFGTFALAQQRGLGLEEARTIVVNMLVALEIVYLFSIRYLRTSSLTWRGVLGTPELLIAVGAVIGLQFAFTYAPMMQSIFQTQPLNVTQGLEIVAVAIAVLLTLEVEKWLWARLFPEKDSPSGMPPPSNCATAAFDRRGVSRFTGEN